MSTPNGWEPWSDAGLWAKQLTSDLPNSIPRRKKLHCKSTRTINVITTTNLLSEPKNHNEHDKAPWRHTTMANGSGFLSRSRCSFGHEMNYNIRHSLAIQLAIIKSRSRHNCVEPSTTAFTLIVISSRSENRKEHFRLPRFRCCFLIGPMSLKTGWCGTCEMEKQTAVNGARVSPWIVYIFEHFNCLFCDVRQTRWTVVNAQLYLHQQ